MEALCYGFSFGFSGSALVGRPLHRVARNEEPDGSTHMVAVWYWFDGAHIYIATSTRTRKARNLQSTPKISLMIDSRDPAASCGINIVGTAQILTGEPSRKWNGRVHAKYLSDAALADPRVGPVFASWDDVTIQITRPRSSLGICAKQTGKSSAARSRTTPPTCYRWNVERRDTDD